MPLSQPHADTMKQDDTGRDTDRHVCVCVWTVQAETRSVCRLRLMEHDGGGVDYRGDYHYLVTLA